MISEKQLKANRANAQKSTGPTTAAGKQRSRMNAFRHGACSRIMTGEEQKAFQEFERPIIADFACGNAVEHQLASSYATLQWRINRLSSVEDTLFSLGEIEEIAENLNIEHAQAHTAACHAKTFRRDAGVFDRISMYTQRLVNSASRVLAQLEKLQRERLAREAREIQEAALIHRLHLQNGGAFDPTANGFVVTMPQVEAFIRRQDLKNPLFVTEEVRRARQNVAWRGCFAPYPPQILSNCPPS